MTSSVLPGSFRDPSGFLFNRDGRIYRQVNHKYQEDYDRLISSGLYEALVKGGLLIAHEEVGDDLALSNDAYKIIKPEMIPFISYPYEWCFSQLRDAALTTLQIQKKAFDFGMTLKDCSAYNIQFYKGKPVFIDTLSFETYREGQLWTAYRQFCQHFLAPLALMVYTDIRLNEFFRVHIEGVPLDLASSLLPFRTRLKFTILSHIHLHAKSQKHFAGKGVKVRTRKMSRLSFLGIIDSLETAVRKMKWQPWGTEWADYYNDTNYSSNAFQHKKQIVENFLVKINPGIVWDLGANDGTFSRIASDRGIETVSFDIDPAAVEKNYRDCREKKETSILPLLLDLTNPSPGIGWGNRERMGLVERGPADAVMALALIHHLAISNNVPLGKISGYFRELCNYLMIEFVPKNDSQVRRLLINREDIFPDYVQSEFEKSFGRDFDIEASERVNDSERTMYLMRRKPGEV